MTTAESGVKCGTVRGFVPLLTANRTGVRIPTIIEGRFGWRREWDIPYGFRNHLKNKKYHTISSYTLGKTLVKYFGFPGYFDEFSACLPRNPTCG
jgi:hypothetical protein